MSGNPLNPAGAYAGSVVGTVLVLGGLADVTNFCLENPPLGVGAGVKVDGVS